MVTRSHSWSVRLGAIILALATGLLVAGGPASGASGRGAPVEREQTVHQPYEDVVWACGYPLDLKGTITHVCTLRADPRLEGELLFMDQYSFTETYTNASGEWVSATGRGVAKNVPARGVGDSTYVFTYLQAGQPFTIRDSSGAVLIRDSGVIRFQVTVDVSTGEELDFDLTLSGPHPLFEQDTCKAVAPLLGTESASYLSPRPLASTDAGMGYYEYLPPSYSGGGAKSPLLIATNGYGENGDGSAEQLSNLLFTGIPRFIDVGGWPTERPLVVLATQHVEDPPGFDFSPCDGVEPWGGSCAMQLPHDRGHASPAFCTTPGEIHDFITYAVAHYNVDPSRVYLTGLSCGGFGIWEYLAEHGDAQVAAAIPVAADGRPAWATAGCGLATVPLWAFHGGLDDVVNPLGSLETMTNVQQCPGVDPDHAKLTVYPDLTHDGWDQAYSGSEGDDIYTWMLGFSLP